MLFISIRLNFACYKLFNAINIEYRISYYDLVMYLNVCPKATHEVKC